MDKLVVRVAKVISSVCSETWVLVENILGCYLNNFGILPIYTEGKILAISYNGVSHR